MSFTGIFKAKDGLVAIVDSKASKKENGIYVEDSSRNPEKMYPFQDGIAVTFGANQIFVQNSNRLFSKRINIEDFIYPYLQKHQTLDSNFFDDLLIKMSTSPVNEEPVNFIIGRKIRAGEYTLELHQIGYKYYGKRLSKDTDFYFTGGENLYRQAFEQMNLKEYSEKAERLQKFLAIQLGELIECYDKTLEYNSVGKPVKSFIVR